MTTPETTRTDQKDSVSQQVTIQHALDLASQHHRAGELPETEVIYRQILQAEPNHPVALHLLGVIAHQVGKNDIAVGLMSKAIEVEPDYAEAHSNLGNALRSLGRLDEAVAHYHNAVEIKPEYAKAHNNLGNALRELGQLDEAVTHCHKAITIEPDFAMAHNNLGLALQKLGQMDEAAAHCRKAIEILPDLVEAHCNLGNVLRELGRSGEAVAHYRKAVEIKPDFAMAHNNLGNVLRELGNLDEAITHCLRAIDINPSFAMAHNNLGFALQEHGRLEEAIQSYGFAKSGYGRVKSLECLYILERYDEFYRELDKLIELNNTNIGAAALSAFASQQLNRADPHPFCKKPLDFIRVYDFLDGVDDVDGFLNDLVDELKNKLSVWEPSGRSAIKGFASLPELFGNQNGRLADLDLIIKDKIKNYRFEFPTEDCDFIRLFPNKFTLTGWVNRLLKGGHQTEHIHPSGWLSGVLYLQMPKYCTQEEGSIEFGLWGNNYPKLNKNYPRKRYYPKNGDIILFPSSLFHRTIPFHSNKERLSIAFDLIPA